VVRPAGSLYAAKHHPKITALMERIAAKTAKVWNRERLIAGSKTLKFFMTTLVQDLSKIRSHQTMTKNHVACKADLAHNTHCRATSDLENQV
jgi:hypothetical protein